MAHQQLHGLTHFQGPGEWNQLFSDGAPTNAKSGILVLHNLNAYMCNSKLVEGVPVRTASKYALVYALLLPFLVIQLISIVCPACSNVLTVSRVPALQDGQSASRNRFECRTCPYQYVLDRRYYERKPMKRKEVEDVMGGRGAWDNVDQTESSSFQRCLCYSG